MTLPARRLLLCAVLFVGWIGYLGYQVLTRPRLPDGGAFFARPLVVSHPQVLVSQVDVIAEVPNTGGTVTVREVLWPADAPLKEGDEIQVANLEECKADAQSRLDFFGPGKYLLPLRSVDRDRKRYEVAHVPPSPGYSLGGPPRLYPATPAALAQYEQIGKPAAK
jgi:hypothetical protein